MTFCARCKRPVSGILTAEDAPVCIGCAAEEVARATGLPTEGLREVVETAEKYAVTLVVLARTAEQVLNRTPPAPTEPTVIACGGCGRRREGRRGRDVKKRAKRHGWKRDEDGVWHCPECLPKGG